MGGGGTIPNVPDYTRYKWEDIPQLVEHQKRLAERGLHDPWARNHAWKFMVPQTNNITIPWYRHLFVNFPPQRGFLIGLIAIGTFIGIDVLSGGKLVGDDHH